ncbi:MAG: UspA domain protein [Marmoricola sp.]|nr:UspA domain protein [Marmoricola sp.]
MSAAPGTVVVGIDGSESSAHALLWAAEHASAEHRPLTLVHTMRHAGSASMAAETMYSPVALRLVEDAGRDLLAHAREQVERVDSTLEVSDVLEAGDPRVTLLGLSGEAEIVVVGSRGRGPLAGMPLGSVSSAVVRHADCPVVVHRHGDGDVPRHGITVACDAGPESVTVLEFAYQEAELRQLPLTVLHCVWEVGAGTTAAALVPEPVLDLEHERVALAEAVAGMQEKYPDVVVGHEVVRGDPDEVLVRVSEAMDLVVIGTHQRSWFSGVVLRSVGHRLLEDARCPVAVVPVRGRR